jgi:acyl-CoA thioesterase
VFEHQPEVDPPGESGPWAGPFAVIAKRMGLEIEVPKFPDDVGFAQVLEFREPTVHHHPDPGPGRLCLWVRRRDGGPITPAIVAYIADMVPLSISDALGVVAIGISLDNSIRIGGFEETEWVLVDLRPHLAVGDYGHGTGHVWSERGHLLATASQSTAMKRIDLATAKSLDWLPKP